MKKYFYFILLSVKNGLKAKGPLLGFIFFLGAILVIYNNLWNTINLNVSTTVEYKYFNFVWYLLFTEIIILSPPALHIIIEEDIKTGTIAYFLNRPISFFAIRYAEGVGITIVNFTFLSIFGITVTYLLTNVLSFSGLYLTIIILLCFVSALLHLLILMAIGFGALFMHTVKPSYLLVQKGMFVLGGAIFPLIIYPDWILDIAKWTPFYYMFFLVAKQSYNFNWAEVLLILKMDLFWSIIIISLIVLIYRKLYKRVNIYGI